MAMLRMPIRNTLRTTDSREVLAGDQIEIEWQRNRQGEITGVNASVPASFEGTIHARILDPRDGVTRLEEILIPANRLIDTRRIVTLGFARAYNPGVVGLSMGWSV